MDHPFNKTNTRPGGFTIIELLVVIAIIAVLSGIFFGVAGGVRERSRISRAQTELSLLAQYLEQYKAHYGDYPRVSLVDSNSNASATRREGEEAGERLYNALNGMRGVSEVDAQAIFTTIPSGATTPQQRAFIDRSKFDYRYAPSLQPPANPTNPETNAAVLLDPWGRAYRYYYPPPPPAATPPTPNPWENRTFVLYSMGPSGEHQPPTIGTKGFPDKSDPQNLDNIYAN